MTDDRKEDWWYKPKGKTVGPRPELIEEFHSETGQSVLIYSPESFLKYAKQQLKANISRATIGEVEAEKQARKHNESKPDFLDWATDSDLRSRLRHYGVDVLGLYEAAVKNGSNDGIAKLLDLKGSKKYLSSRKMELLKKAKRADAIIAELQMELDYRSSSHPEERFEMVERLDDLQSESKEYWFEIYRIEKLLESY